MEFTEASRAVASFCYFKMQINSGSLCLCGENLSWMIDDGVFSVSGIGDMHSFSTPDMILWYNVRESITSVAIEEGVVQHSMMYMINL